MITKKIDWTHMPESKPYLTENRLKETSKKMYDSIFYDLDCL